MTKTGVEVDYDPPRSKESSLLDQSQGRRFVLIRSRKNLRKVTDICGMSVGVQTCG